MDHFNFFESYYKSGKKLQDEDRLAFYDKLLSYMFDGDESEIDGVAGAVWEAVKPVATKSKKKAESGSIGGKTTATKKDSGANVKQNRSKPQANVKQNRSKPQAIKEEEKEKEKDNTPQTPQGVTEVVSYLNEVCGTKYRANTEHTAKHIRARLHDGFTVEDCKRVIDIKFREWGGDEKMSKFLRPETLFGGKFESYLNQREGERINGNGAPEGWGKDYDAWVEKQRTLYGA